jgi:two-component SAPR family response regulator
MDAIILDNTTESNELDKNYQSNKVFIRTFGRFEIFVDNKPVKFHCSKAKEFIALLVDRKGGIVTTEEMLTYLFEDRPNDTRSKNYCRKVVQRMYLDLKYNNIDDIVIRYSGGGHSLVLEKVDCDYYDYLKGVVQDNFRGEYMSNYSWAEDTLASLI